MVAKRVCFVAVVLVAALSLAPTAAANAESGTALRRLLSKETASDKDPKQYFGTTYGNHCGAGVYNPSKNAIDPIDKCCQAHDSCFTKNCDATDEQCTCNNTFLKCAASVVKKCGFFAFSKGCRFAKNAVVYATAATACTCLKK